MIATIRHTIATLALALAGAAAVVLPAQTMAGEGPVKEVLASNIGLKVDKISGGNICTVVSKDECQPGKAGSPAGGFEHPENVAGAPDGSVYVTDRGNHRVQELAATGQFLLMFGWDVNKTKITQASKGATVTQAEENVCVAAEECQAGIEGPAPGQFGERLEGITVDPASGDVYVADVVKGPGGEGERIQKFAPGGQWLLEMGKEVNETKVNLVKAKGGTPTQRELEEENLCTQEEEMKGAKCVGPGRAPEAGLLAKPGAFVSIAAIGVGGPTGRLYVGETEHIQEFGSGGEPVSEPAETISARLKNISPQPSSQVSQIAVDNSCSLHKPALTESTIPTCKEFDPSYGDVYLTYKVPTAKTNIVRRFDANGNETELVVNPRTEGATVSVRRIAVDPVGRLAVVESEDSPTSSEQRGALYKVGADGLHLITGFTMTNYPSYIVSGIAFNDAGDLYAVSEQPGHEVAAYVPVPVGELVTGSISSCTEGAKHETDATIDCILNGQVDPWGVPQTEAWFDWGATPALGGITRPQPIKSEKDEGEEEPSTNVTATLEGLRPNETLYYRLVGEDKNVRPPELLTGERNIVKTPIVPPRIVGEPSVLYVHSSSVVMFGRVNPENTPTRYAFQYIPQEACKSLEENCPGLAETKTLEAPDYGTIDSTIEATGLQPATTYRYRLFATNEKNDTARNEQGGKEIPEGTFTTALAPVPQAATGASSAIMATSATISGTVNPAGRPATYAFELGIDKGLTTQYGIVFSGSAGANGTPVEKQLELTGLQPGTRYAYRIKVSSGYGTAYGSSETFTTTGLASLLTVLGPSQMLALPPFRFPAERKPPVKCRHGYKRGKHDRCVKSKSKSHGRGAKRRKNR